MATSLTLLYINYKCTQPQEASPINDPSTSQVPYANAQGTRQGSSLQHVSRE